MAFGCAFALTYALCGLLTIHYRTWLLDHPNARSLHHQPIPRSGGIALITGMLVGGGLLHILVPGQWAGVLLLCALPVIVVSLLDDYRSQSPLLRLIAHSVSAGAIAFYFPLQPSELASFESVGFETHHVEIMGFLIATGIGIWCINLYNFMDGMDGLAGCMAVIGFGTLALWGWRADHLEFMHMNLLLVAVSSAFLCFNHPPARIFLGDTGACTLGLALAAMGLWAHHDGLTPGWLPLLVFSPFIVDATATLVRRIGRGEAVWQSHRSHHYQRLALKYGVVPTLRLEAGLMIACSLSALWAQQADAGGQGWVIGLWLGFYGAVLGYFWHALPPEPPT